MSESAPKISYEQQVSAAEFTEGLPPRDEAIDTVRNKIVSIQEELDQAKERAETPGFKATANDLIDAKLGYRDLKAEKEPELEAVRTMWAENGGPEIEAAEEAVANLNFRSDANDHVAAKTRLRDAKDAFYANLKANETRVHDNEEAYDLAYEEAADKTRVHDEGEAYDQAHEEKNERDGEEALEKLIAGSLPLRQMDMLSKEIDELRREGGDPARLKAKEDLLNDLLLEYEDSDDFDPAIADMLMDRSDAAARREAGRRALFGEDAEDESIPEVKTTGAEGDDDEETIPEVKTTGAEEDDEDGEGIPEVKTTGAEDDGDEGSEDDPETRPPENLSATDRLRRLFDRGEREPGDRRRMIRRALGAVAVATVVVAGAVLLHRYGTDISSWLDSFNSNADAMGQPDVHATTPNFDGYIDVVDGNPAVATPDTLPPSTGFDYPWNWAEKAVGGDQAMGFLEGLANKAEAAGHAVEWHGSGTTKWVEVDGNSNTQHVINVLRQYR